MTPLPPQPWQLVAADIFGPLPGGEKVLVLKCLRSKWPELKVFLRNQSTDADGVISAMEKMFLTHGVPETVRTDNGPPFNGKAFKSFSERIGFQTQKVTPLWPEANGQAEAFMKCLGKIVRTAHIENKDWKAALYRFLLAYRATPHPSTGVAPAKLMYPGRPYRTLLPNQTSVAVSEQAVADFNRRAMAAAKAYADGKRKAVPCSLALGDTVLVRQQKRNKLTSFFDPQPLRIVDVKGSMITAVRDDWKVVRNSSFFKKIPKQDCDADAGIRRPSSNSAGASGAGRQQPTFPTAGLGVQKKNAIMLPVPNLPPDRAAAERVPEIVPVNVMPDRPIGFPENDGIVNEDQQDQEIQQEESSDSDNDVFADVEEAVNDAGVEVPPIHFFHPPENLAIPTRSFNIPKNLRNAPIKGTPAYNTRSRSRGGPD